MRESKIQFDFYKNPNTTVNNSTATYHARINNNKTIDLNDISETLQRSTTATKVDIMAVMTGIKEIMIDELTKGNVVNLNGICRIEPILGIKEGTCSGTENGNQVGLKTVKIRPLKSLVKEVKSKLNPCQRHPVNHSDKVSVTNITEQLVLYFRTNTYITRRILEEKFGLTRYMAYQVLNQLQEKGWLIHPGHRNNSMYLPTAEFLKKKK